MTLWIWFDEGRAVLEMAWPELELLVYFGDGTTRAAWFCSQTGALLMWADVGAA